MAAFTKLRVIPMPKEVCGVDNDGNFAIAKIQPKIYTDNEKFKKYAETFAEYAGRIHGADFEIACGGIEIYTDLGLAKGEYRIDCNENNVKIYACEDNGVTNALSTVLQLMCVDGECIDIPLVKISDKPDCEFRSLMVDLARQWHPFETLFEYIDLCYLYKVKYLHLHFIDTQSYTLPSDIFPGVSTEDRHYTKAQIAELNEYAHARNIELIPEIEVPGHAAAMVNAYPELFANTLEEKKGDEADPTAFKTNFKNNIICVGKPGIMDNLKKLVEEIIEMFPYSKYLHIGGDEAEINEWNYCTDCKKYMAEHGISTVRELYTHFTKLMTDMVLGLGRTPIVWEGFPKEGNEAISRDVLVIAWESYYHLAPDLVEEGFNIVNASWVPMYIVPNRRWTPEEIMAWNVYNWQHWWPKSEARLNPIHLQPTKQVKGGLLCAWECTYEQDIQPVRENLAALAERTWNIRRYADNEQFREKLEYVLEMAKTLAVK
ncbi:MAG: hypothetical protein E7588_00465 [Ruminococcaceae bacterium]|nr:hypothetical protein [Oscillospiraceae bacterium]